MRRCGSEGLRTFRARLGPCEDTCRAKLFRKRRFVRPETRQRLGAPSLGSGKLQTPPNRYPPARLLQLRVEAKPSWFALIEGDAEKTAFPSHWKGRFPARPPQQPSSNMEH